MLVELTFRNSLENNVLMLFIMRLSNDNKQVTSREGTRGWLAHLVRLLRHHVVHSLHAKFDPVSHSQIIFFRYNNANTLEKGTTNVSRSPVDSRMTRRDVALCSSRGVEVTVPHFSPGRTQVDALSWHASGWWLRCQMSTPRTERQEGWSRKASDDN